LVVDFCFFHESNQEVEQKLSSGQYDYIYFKDPFNYSYTKENIEDKFEIVMKNLGSSYLIDNLKNINDVYLEDKWHQYQLFNELMPQTRLLTNLQEINNPGSITKKRISSRAKGIIFNSKDFEGDELSEYIIQEKIKIDKEYRVYVIFDQIINKGSIRRSRTNDIKVKIVGVEELLEDVMSYTRQVIEKNKFDFIGLDIARSGDKLYLLEINRSCLFNGYFRESGENLAEPFIDGLLQK